MIKKNGLPLPSAPTVTKGFVPEVQRCRLQERTWNIMQSFKGSLKEMRSVL